jgi:hypothetical protein
MEADGVLCAGMPGHRWRLMLMARRQLPLAAQAPRATCKTSASTPPWNGAGAAAQRLWPDYVTLYFAGKASRDAAYFLDCHGPTSHR